MSIKHVPVKEVPNQDTYPKLVRARRWSAFKLITWLVIFIFTFQQIAYAGDRIYRKYDYSRVTNLLTGSNEYDQADRMSPGFLMAMQARHEELIRSKNLVEDDMHILLNRRNHAQNTQIADLPLKKKRGAGGSSGSKQIAYTLTDFDSADKPQQISIYNYASDGETLESVVTYDIRDINAAKWISGDGVDVEEISEEGEAKVLG